MAPLPLLKLSALVLKTIAKPVASYLKAAAPKYQRLSNVYIDVGQRVHWITTKINIIASGHKVLTINPLPEAEALSRGIDFLSEVFVFAFGGVIIMVEFARSEAKNAAKAKQAADDEKAFKDGLENNFEKMRNQISDLQKELSLVEEVLLKENPTKYHALKKAPKQEEVKPVEVAPVEPPPPSLLNSFLNMFKL